ncbi:hypothetical protein SLS54_004221 [Diplodia seriata]
MGLPLKEESWIWYSLVIFVAAARFASRILLFRGDLRKLQIDDYIIALALCSYTTLIVTINIVAFTESNLLPPGFDMDSLTPPDVAERRFGSKLVLVVEQCQCVTIWAVKYYSFTNPFGGLWTYWYTRESSTSLLVANLPYTWTLLRRLFNLRSFDGRSSGTGTATENGSRFNYHSNRTARGRHASIQPNMLNGEPVSSPPSALTTPNGKLLRRSDSHTVTTRGSVDYANRRHSGAPTMGAASTLDSSRSSAARSENLLLKTYPHNHEVYGRADQEALCVEPWDFGIDLGGSVAEEAEEEEGSYRDYRKNREKLFKDAYMDIDPARLGLDSAHREAADLREFERAMLRGDAWDEEAAIGGDGAAPEVHAPAHPLPESPSTSRPGSSHRSTTTTKPPSSPTQSLVKE